MCGPTVIDGYAFCLGVDSLKKFHDTRVDLQSLIPSVTFLIRGAIFRPSYTLSGRGKVSQDICSLGELIDMYHTHKATLRHDKVYALLGMSSDDASKANLLLNYSVPWEELFQRLIKFLVCEKISVETWADKEEIAVIKSKGCILGKVSSVRIGRNGRLDVDVIFNNISKQPGHGEWSGHWIVQSSARSIQDEDLICLLQGASKPTIIRLCKVYFAIIMIAATLESTQTGSEDIKWPNLLQSANVFPAIFYLSGTGKIPRAVARSRKLRSFDTSKQFGTKTCYDRVRRPIGQRDQIMERCTNIRRCRRAYKGRRKISRRRLEKSIRTRSQANIVRRRYLGPQETDAML